MSDEERTAENLVAKQRAAMLALRYAVEDRLRDCERAGCDFSEAESAIEDALGRAAW